MSVPENANRARLEVTVCVAVSVAEMAESADEKCTVQLTVVDCR